MRLFSKTWWAATGVSLCVLSSLSPLHAYEERSALSQLKERFLGAEPTVRLLIARDADHLLVEVQGKYHVYDPADGEWISSGHGKKLMVQPLEDGIAWGEEFPGRYQFSILPRDDQTCVFVNGMQYCGALSIYHVDGKLFAVNELPVEDYLHAILPSYLQGGPKGEALPVAAIVARTDLLAQVSARPHAIWHLDGKKVGYLGAASAYQDPDLDAAIVQTEGLVMVAGQARLPFRCRWEEIPGSPLPASRLFGIKVSDEVAGASQARTQWSCSLPKTELAKLAQLSAVQQVTAQVDAASGGVQALTVSDGHQKAVVSIAALREQLGDRRLRSSAFHVQMTGDHVRFTGGGQPAGVDLFAAYEMAQQGRDAAAILRAFFPAAKIHAWGE